MIMTNSQTLTGYAMLLTQLQTKFFSECILQAVEKREKLLIMNSELQVETVPEIVSIFSR